MYTQTAGIKLAVFLFGYMYGGNSLISLRVTRVIIIYDNLLGRYNYIMGEGSFYRGGIHMTYTTPNMEIVVYFGNDIITVSTGTETGGDNNNVGWG